MTFDFTELRASDLAAKARQIAKNHNWNGEDQSNIEKAVKMAMTKDGIGEDDANYDDLRIGAEVRLEEMLQLEGIFRK